MDVTSSDIGEVQSPQRRVKYEPFPSLIEPGDWLDEIPPIQHTRDQVGL